MPANAYGGYTEDLEQLSIMLLNVWRAFVCLSMKSHRYDLLFKKKTNRNNNKNVFRYYSLTIRSACLYRL